MFKYKAVMVPMGIILATQLQGLTLKEATVQTLENNPAIMERMKNYNATQQDVRIAKAGYYPTLDLQAGIGYQDISNSVTGFEKKAQDIYETSLVFNQNLFNGLSTTYQVSTHEARVMGAAYSFIEKANDVSFQLTNTYINVLRERELLDISVQNIEINEKIFDKVATLYESGMTTLSEQQKIDSSLSLARSNYFVAQNNFKDSQYSFKKNLGRFIDPEVLVTPEFSGMIPESKADAQQYALRNNPSIRISDYDLKVAQEDYKEKRGRYMPNLDAEVRQGLNSNLNGVEGDEDDFRAMLILSYNLYRGGADDAEVQKRMSIINKEVAYRSDLKRQVMEGFDLSWTAYEELQNQLVHLQKYKEFSLKTLVLYSDEYDMGRRTLLDLLAAQNDLISAKKQLVNAKYDLLFAKYRILDSMGMMVQEIMGDTDSLYSRVGLGSQDLEYEDTLPVSLDSDADLVSDLQDICQNSDSKIISDLYGCEDKSKEFDRVATLSYEDDRLQEESNKALDAFIKNYKDLGSSANILIVSHVAASDDDESDMNASIVQAQNVRDYMLDSNISSERIITDPKGSMELLWTQDKDEGIEKNRRTDIIMMTELEQAVVTPSAAVVNDNAVAEETQLENIKASDLEIEEVAVVAVAAVEDTPVAVADYTGESVYGPVIIMGTFNKRDAAHEFARKFENISDTHAVVEAAKGRYNVKLIVTDETQIQNALSKATQSVPDAWYAGVQTVVVDR